MIRAKNMNLVQLSKKETKDLEWDSTAIEQIICAQQNKILNNKLMILTSFIHTHGLNAADLIKKRKAKLSQLLNCTCNYRIKGEYLSDVYGLSWNNQNFVIYYSKRGLTIQVNNKFDISLMEKFVDKLIDLLVDSTSEFCKNNFAFLFQGK